MLWFTNCVEFNFGKRYLPSDSHTNTIISDHFAYPSRCLHHVVNFSSWLPCRRMLKSVIMSRNWTQGGEWLRCKHKGRMGECQPRSWTHGSADHSRSRVNIWQYSSNTGTFRSEDEDDHEYEFFILSVRIRFRGRHFSKCACLEQKTRTRSCPRPPI